MKQLLATILLLCSVSLFAQNAPEPQPDFFVAFEDFQLLSNIDPLANDVEPDGDGMTWEAIFGPFNGQLVPGLFGATQYLSDPNFNGFDFFTYRVCDDEPEPNCATSLAFITVTNTNDAPEAFDDYYSTPEDVATMLDVTVNDVDIDGDVLYPTITDAPNHGTAVINGLEVLYTPSANFVGLDSFEYKVCDSALFSFLCPRAWAHIEVVPVNDPPVAVDDSFAFTEQTSIYTAELLVNDTDEEGDSIYISEVYSTDSALTIGVLTVADGVLNFTYNEEPCGADTFFYVACNVDGGCDTAMVLITLPCVDDLHMPEGISPDGDGMNDVLVFRGLSKYSPAMLQVFNRWGMVVYENEDYQNTWGGTSLESSEPLPDGSYFYILKLSNGGGEWMNYLIVQR